ncbi:MAG: cytochrome c oxidase subunit II [Acidobacteria bacterium]|nr:cytochrome c oxidase subunit II [Acidobacteriota bacterium]
MGKILALLIVLIVVGSVWSFVSGHWWFPVGISEHAGAIDAQFKRTAVVVAVAFIASQLALAYAVFKYGSKGSERAIYSHGNNKLEAIWTGITAVIFIILAFLGQVVWYNLHIRDAAPGAVQVDVVGQQFQWNFHYPGKDGIMGSTDAKYINDAALNYVGLNPDDETSKDDIQMSILVIPEKRPVAIKIRSKDVIHDLFIPALRIKQDAVPGMNVAMHFTATKTGKYEIACAELCGSLHYNMKTFMLVVSQDEYDQLSAMSEDKFKERINQLMAAEPLQ